MKKSNCFFRERNYYLNIDYTLLDKYSFRYSIGFALRTCRLYFLGLLRFLAKSSLRYHLLTPSERNNFSPSLISSAFKAYLRAFQGWKEKELTANEQHIYQDLQSNGVSIVEIEESRFPQLVRYCEQALALLRAKRGNKKTLRHFEESRIYLSDTYNLEIYSEMKSMFNEMGILKASEKYLQRDCRIVEISPQINDVSDNFWVSSEENEIGCNYIHYDGYGDHVKVILYFSEVRAVDSGPFSYIFGSHKNESKCKTFLSAVCDEAGLTNQSDISRKGFSMLPRFLQHKCSFGSDIMSNDSKCQELLGCETILFGGKMTAIVFDVRGFHRGAMVKSGERLSCTSVVG